MKYRSANLSEFALHCEGLIGKGYVFHDLYIATRRGRRVYEGVFKSHVQSIPEIRQPAGDR